MNIEQFISNFSTIFDEINETDFNMDFNFKNHVEWSSLSALSLLAVMEEEYGVALTHTEIKNSNTINDIYTIVKNKL